MNDVRAYRDSNGRIWRKAADGKWLLGDDGWNMCRQSDGTCKDGYGWTLDDVKQYCGPLVDITQD